MMRRKGISIGWGGKLCSAVSCSALQRSLLTSVSTLHYTNVPYHSLSYCRDSTMRDKADRLASKRSLDLLESSKFDTGFHTILKLDGTLVPAYL